MARADTRTWLSLDEWASIFQIDPFHFNGIVIGLNPPNPACNDLWCQFGWQAGKAVSRDDIARSIADAENIISDYVGYNLKPDWLTDERHRTTRHHRREAYATGVNVRGQYKSIKVRKGYAVAGGVKTKSVINLAAPIVREDRDGDGYDETAVVTVTTAIQDPNQIRAYFPDEQDDIWEIRPIKVTPTGTQLIIEFPIYLVPDPDLWEGYNCLTGIDGDDPTSFVSTIAVYRVFNDSSVGATFLWEPPNQAACGDCGSCSNCCYTTQTGCFQVRDERIGVMAYIPDGYSWSEYRQPDQIVANYYSGWRWPGAKYPCVQLDPFWADAIAYLSLGLLRREVCSCCDEEAFINKWAHDRALIPDVGDSYQMPKKLLENPFGTTEGALEAWRRVNSDGRRLGARYWS